MNLVLIHAITFCLKPPRRKEKVHKVKTPACADVFTPWYPRQESNLYLGLRRPLLYPLSYGGMGQQNSGIFAFCQ